MIKALQILSVDLYRITEQNDWVLICMLLCVAGLFTVLNSFNREATLLEFFTQNPGDSPNDTATWASVSVIFWILVSVLFSQYVAVVPAFVRFEWFPLQLNKMGYTLLSVGIISLAKSLLTYLFYLSCGDDDRLRNLRFYLSRFYFVLCIVLIVAIFINYFLGLGAVVLLKSILISTVAVSILRIVYLIINGNRLLPKQWFYKILYICTLQTVPLLVVYRMLFF